MVKQAAFAQVSEVLEREAAAHGLELVTVEQAGGRGTPVVRVLLDRAGGIDLDAVSAASGWISEILDSAELFDCPYTLEVSSPGVDRPLVKPADFDKFAGETATVKTRAATGGPAADDRALRRTTWTGTIVGLAGSDVLLDVEGERVSIPYETISKARLKGVVDFGKGKERSRR